MSAPAPTAGAASVWTPAQHELAAKIHARLTASPHKGTLTAASVTEALQAAIAIGKGK